MMRSKNVHLPATLTLLTFGISILFLLLLSIILSFSSLIDLFSPNGAPAAQMIGAAAFGFQILLLILCGWFVFQKVQNSEKAEHPFTFPFADWHLIPVIGLVLGGVLIGGLVAYSEIPWLGWLVLPAATIFVIIPPIWLLIGYGSRGLEAGPRWRVFAIFGLGMTVAPMIMILLEIFLLIIFIILAMLFLAVLDPILFQDIARIAEVIQAETNEEVILNLLAPYLSNPIFLGAGIGYIAIIVPLIEELLKPLAVWLFASKIETPSQGFVLGLLSGAAFAVLESLNAGADGSTSWPVIVSVRAGTSILHMTASGLVGWGIVSAFKEKRYGRLVAAYFSAVLIHGVWNASAAGAGISAIGETIGKPEWLFNFTPALICGLIVLGVGMFAVLLASNRKLRPLPTPDTTDQTDVKEEEVKLPA